MSSIIATSSLLPPEQVELARRPLAQAYTLPSAAYTSEQVYQEELNLVQRRSWHAVARLEQLPEPGDYLSLDLFGQPIVVIRGEDNAVRALSRVCLHRAATLVDGSGNLDKLSCPYHRWSYSLDGTLLRAPLMDGAEEFEPGTMCLPRFNVELWNGFVMVNLDTEAAPFASQVTGLSEHFEPYKLGDMRIVRTMDYPSGWNWKVLVENFMEAYHHIGTHSETLGPEYRARESFVDNAEPDWSLLSMPNSQAATTDEDLDLFAAVAFPQFLFAVTAGGLIWYQVLPKNAHELMLKIHVAVPESALSLPDIEQLIETQVATVQTVHDEDISANNLVWQGLGAPFTKQGRLSPLEGSIWQLNQWWLDRMCASNQ